MKKPQHIWVGIGFFIVFVLVLIPAQVLSIPLNKISGLEVEGISGKIWQGRASSVNYRGIHLGQAEWDISAVSLLLFKLSLDISIQGENSDLTAYLSFRPSSVEAENLKARFPASWIPALAKSPFQAQGKMLIRMKRVNLSKKSPPYLYGALSWQQARLKTPFSSEAQLGTINIGITTEKKWLVGNMQSAQGPMDLKATLRFKYPKKIDLKGSVADKLPSELDGFFRLFAKKTKGRLTFKYQGVLPKL